MKTKTVYLAIALLGASGVAVAGDRGAPDYRTGFYRQDEARLAATSVQAPEIDPASWVAALTLLGGGLIVMRGRRTRDPQA
ncbi:MAG: hypothetical protein ACLP0B_28195 [Steroidobacteraceae bacterium]|jgi:hypothetical protein